MSDHPDKPAPEVTLEGAIIQVKDWAMRKSTINPDTGCWIWNGRPTAKGYAKTVIANKHVRVHRYVYEAIYGPIGGLTVDHLCRVRNCINPYHLEAVTAKENNLRGLGVTAINAKAKTCKNGHPFDRVKNRSDGTKQRVCSICKNVHLREYKMRKKARAMSAELLRGLGEGE